MREVEINLYVDGEIIHSLAGDRINERTPLGLNSLIFFGYTVLNTNQFQLCPRSSSNIVPLSSTFKRAYNSLIKLGNQIKKENQNLNCRVEIKI